MSAAGETVRCLAVTSSTGVMSLAIGDLPDDPDATPADVVVLASVDVATERRHAEEITPRLSELLDRTGTRPDELGRLVVDIGPGRFTGLRVGLATVRAMAFGLDIPVVPLTSLEILALGPPPADGPIASITAVVDARRQEVFQQRFADGRPVGDAVVGPAGDVAVDGTTAESGCAVEPGIAVGDGADRYRDDYVAAGLRVVEGRNPDAATMLGLAAGRVAKAGTMIEPLYLRGPDANPNVKTRPIAPAGGKQ